MSNKLNLRLVLDIEYDAGDVPPADLEDNLDYIVRQAMGNGTFTGESEATVEHWRASVIEITEDGEDPVYTLWDWAQIVAQRSTLLGYWEWVDQKREEEES